MRVLLPLPARDFDLTEASVPWATLSGAGHEVVFATPNGEVAEADDRVITGEGLGWPARFLVADRSSVTTYRAMQDDPGFGRPLSYKQMTEEVFDGIVLPGGHAEGMKTYLESEALSAFAASHMVDGKPIGAICHGVIALARASHPDTGEPLLSGRTSTGLTERMELTAWRLTRGRMGDYYRTYPETVESETRRALGKDGTFVRGPSGLRGMLDGLMPGRDSASNLGPGFTVKDENYLSARWPGDAHRFSHDFLAMLEA